MNDRIFRMNIRLIDMIISQLTTYLRSYCLNVKLQKTDVQLTIIVRKCSYIFIISDHCSNLYSLQISNFPNKYTDSDYKQSVIEIDSKLKSITYYHYLINVVHLFISRILNWLPGYQTVNYKLSITL